MVDQLADLQVTVRMAAGLLGRSEGVQVVLMDGPHALMVLPCACREDESPAVCQRPWLDCFR